MPGNYAIVDHSLFRAFNKGAVGTLTVSGPDNKIVYSGKEADTIYTGGPIKNEPVKFVFTPQAKSDSAGDAAKNEFAHIDPSLREQYSRGKQVYMQTCFVCHQPNGLGVGDQIPPLAKSDVLMNDRTGAIRGVLQGRSGELIVKGKKYNATMTPLPQLNDQQIADVITYVRNTWGNSDTNAVNANEVAALRKTIPAIAANQFE